MLASSLFLKALGSSLPAFPSRVSLDPWVSPPWFLSLDAHLHGWAWVRAPIPALHTMPLLISSQFQTLDGASCPEPTGGMFALYLLWPSAGDPRKGAFPTLENFAGFSSLLSRQGTFLGVFFIS